MQRLEVLLYIFLICIMFYCQHNYVNGCLSQLMQRICVHVYVFVSQDVMIHPLSLCAAVCVQVSGTDLFPIVIWPLIQKCILS